MRKLIVIYVLICLLPIVFSGCQSSDENVVSDASSVSETDFSTNDSSSVHESLPEDPANNPIDRAFLHMKTTLSQEELQSETFAYVYAKQWYDELKNITKIIDDNYYFFFPLDYDSYITQQVHISLAISGEEENASSQLNALGDFLRSETMRFKTMLAEEGKEHAFTTDEMRLVQELTSYDYSLSKSLEWAQENPLLPIAADPEKQVYLYLASPFGQLLNISGKSTLQIDWPGLSPRGGGLRPRMTVCDIDGDMADEIVVIHTPYLIQVGESLGYRQMNYSLLNMITFPGQSTEQ